MNGLVAMVQLSQVLEMVEFVKHHILLGRICCEGGGQEGGRAGGEKGRRTGGEEGRKEKCVKQY